MQDQAWPKVSIFIPLLTFLSHCSNDFNSHTMDTLYDLNVFFVYVCVGHIRGKQVILAEVHTAKIASTIDAIGDSDFFLVARTDARAISAKIRA